jgi:hypothetical protein
MNPHISNSKEFLGNVTGFTNVSTCSTVHLFYNYAGYTDVPVGKSFRKFEVYLYAGYSSI